jgi:hypothetical protein
MGHTKIKKKKKKKKKNFSIYSIEIPLYVNKHVS